MELMWRFAEKGEFVERECLLFEAGDYPDKGMTITEEDLRQIARRSDAILPIKIEHLSESPFDGVLGVMTGLHVRGKQLWGTLRQPLDAWRLAQRAGARSLSVALDVAGRRLLETSFVCHPRVRNAQVFCDTDVVQFAVNDLFAAWEGGVGAMSNARQFAEGLIAYLRGFLGSEEGTDATEIRGETAEFAREREAMAAERARFRAERADQQVLEWKRQGRLRATERAESLARALLLSGEETVTTFDEASVPLSVLFARFMAENGPVVPLGELMAADRFSALNRGGGSSAGERLVSLAQERSRKEGLSYVQSFAAVTAENPDLAQAARE